MGCHHGTVMVVTTVTATSLKLLPEIVYILYIGFSGSLGCVM